MTKDFSTALERFAAKIKSNPIVSIVLFIGTLVGGLSSFTHSAQTLLALIHRDFRPAINGEWSAEVVYDWSTTHYPERFIFKGEGDEIRGTASFLMVQRGILEGLIKKNTLRFMTKTQEITGSQEGGEVIHRYSGVIEGDRINFTLQTEGGLSAHRPIEFIARKIPPHE